MRLQRIGILLAAAGLASSQTPVFEVASIKPSGPRSVRGSDGGPGSSDPGQYRFGQATLLDLIVVAWHVEVFQISSKDALDKQSFDLSAKLPEGTTKAQFRMMMQSLLGERFHLKTHLESRDFPTLELVVAKTGLKIAEAVPGAAPPKPQGDYWPDLAPARPDIRATMSPSGGFFVTRLISYEEPISLLAQMLRPEGRPAIDATGLSGRYSFTLEYSTPEPNISANDASDPSGVPDLFTAVQQQLGLQLIREKLPFDVVAVDSVDKLPTEN